MTSARNLRLAPQILREHLTYEFEMLNRTAEQLRGGLEEGVIKNALIESFCLHARNLVEFFGTTKYVSAAVFVDDSYLRPRQLVEPQLVTRLNTQVAHITYARTSVPAEKIGDRDIETLLSALNDQANVFSKHLKPEFRDDWKSVSRGRANTLLVEVQPPTATNVIDRSQTET